MVIQHLLEAWSFISLSFSYIATTRNHPQPVEVLRNWSSAKLLVYFHFIFMRFYIQPSNSVKIFLWIFKREKSISMLNFSCTDISILPFTPTPQNHYWREVHLCQMKSGFSKIIFYKLWYCLKRKCIIFLICLLRKIFIFKKSILLGSLATSI